MSETPNEIDNYYKKYDVEFSESIELEEKLNFVMKIIKSVYNYFNGNISCLKNKNYFFTFYSTLVNQIYGIKDCNFSRNSFLSREAISNNFNLLYRLCSDFLSDYNKNIEEYCNRNINSNWTKFRENHSKRTTNKLERYNRIEFMNKFFK